ncbi:hypothetical protein J0X19_15580 [Hymenobacter sp. BT186]|uniref:Uncharacterized protein n=1 Tax=Hymenobacter telluris TaxID=2816474 RepID=A0A939EWZ3_9BACT|nr:hypothetical protein [Hymenobacter telluris]MBO0359384.1 hypothetical protein [Hymenobacter telluris]MBW3375410.1 hypothetical protein [Hymenobacter norwichensis]
MQLVAYRPEYHVRVDEARNRMIYERFEELTIATELPHYLPDLQRALTLLRPGFTVLADLRRTLGPNLHLLPVFLASHTLMMQAGIGMMAEVHPLSHTMYQISQAVRAQTHVPARQFTSREEAEAFLDSFQIELNPEAEG